MKNENENTSFAEQPEKKERLVGKKFAKLIDVKSLVTLTLTGVFAYLATVKIISGQEFLTIFTVVIAFYFGTQTRKNDIST